MSSCSLVRSVSPSLLDYIFVIFDCLKYGHYCCEMLGMCLPFAIELINETIPMKTGLPWCCCVIDSKIKQVLKHSAGF